MSGFFCKLAGLVWPPEYSNKFPTKSFITREIKCKIKTSPALVVAVNEFVLNILAVTFVRDEQKIKCNILCSRNGHISQHSLT